MSSKDLELDQEERVPISIRVPKLRFPDFRDAGEWEQELLAKLARPVSERAPAGKDVIALTLSGEHGLVRQSEYFGKQIGSENSGRYIKVRRNDLVYNDRTTKQSTYGSIKRLTQYEAGIVSPIYKCFRFSADQNSSFWEWYFESGSHEEQLSSLVNEGARSGRFNISIDRFLSTSVLLPGPREQEKIADCLSSSNELIAVEIQKLNALNAHKKSLMRELFPSESESIPHRRFPEFQGMAEWEKDSLCNIATTSSGTTPSRAESRFYEGGTIPWVKTTDLTNSFIGRTEECVTEAAKVRINPVGSVLIAMYGGFNQIGRTGYLTMPAATNQAISVLNVDSLKVDPSFLLFWLNAKIDLWKRIASSSRKDPNITSADVARFPIAYPSLAEQAIIVKCLSHIEALIAAQTLTIKSLRDHKSSLLQQLFPVMDEVQS